MTFRDKNTGPKGHIKMRTLQGTGPEVVEFLDSSASADVVDRDTSAKDAIQKGVQSGLREVRAASTVFVVRACQDLVSSQRDELGFVGISSLGPGREGLPVPTQGCCGFHAQAEASP